MKAALLAVLVAASGCAHGEGRGSTIALRPACSDSQYFDGAACKPAGDAPKKLAVGEQALAELKIDEAKVALDAAFQAGPFDHKTHVSLWEQRGIAAAYTDDEASATSAFDMVLALDPTHFLSYELSPKATLVFEKSLKATKARGAAPSIDVNWQRGGKVGDPVPLDVEVLADPKQFLKRATLFVRTGGDPGWRAADVALGSPGERHLLLPPITAQKSVSLELYLRAYDDRGNEVLTWADPTKPREIALRYEAPTPWYRKWWGITSLVGGGALVVGAIVYVIVQSPPDKIDGDVIVP